MEGCGARLGRSSTRYGAPTTTVFNGRVRKWKKRWVHLSSNNNNNHISNGNSNGNNGPHLLIYKWTPLSRSSNKDSKQHNVSDSSNLNYNNNNSNNDNNDDDVSNGSSGVDKSDLSESEPPRRKFKYIPVDLIERQKIETAEKEAAEKGDDEANINDADPNEADSPPITDGFNNKPDINDIPMEENQDDHPVMRQDLNESTFDLSDPNTNADESKDDGQLERDSPGVGR